MSNSSSSQNLPPPEQYQAFIREVELREARLVHCEVESLMVLRDAMQVSYQIEVDNTLTWLDEGFEAIQDCTISFFIEEGDEEVPAGHVQVAYGFGYACAFEDEEYERDAYLQIFEQVSLPINAWPFIRQFVHDMTQRMNWPPLMLPLLKSDSEAPTSSAADTES